MPRNNTENIKDSRPLTAKKSNVSDQAKWKLAKAYLKSKDLDLARKLLTELTDHANSFRDKATKTLQEINN